MKTYLKLFIIFFNCVFSISMFSQGQEKTKETELEAEIINLISKKNNFNEFKMQKIASYNNLTEYGTNVRPLNWSYKLTVLENSNNNTSAFVYTNNVDMEGVYFFVRLFEFLTDETKSWKQVYEQEKVKSISRVTITYKGKAVGFMQHDTRNYASKVIIFIGSLKMEDIDAYLSAQKEEEKLDFFKESNPTKQIQENTKSDTADFFRDLSAFLDSISPPKKIVDSAEKAKADKETILAFVSQFDAVDMGKWTGDAKKYGDSLDKQKKTDASNAAMLESYNLRTMQQEIMLLLSQRSNGFIDLKKAVQSKTAEKIYYYAKPNYFMKASSEYVIEKNGKNAYCAYYKDENDKSLSSNAFLTLPYFNKSQLNLTLEVSKLKEPNKIRYDIILDNKVVASYIIYTDTKINSIQVYESGY